MDKNERFLEEQADLIRKLAEGYRQAYRIIHRVELDDVAKLRMIKDTLDDYYPGRHGLLFRDAFGKK